MAPTANASEPSVPTFDRKSLGFPARFFELVEPDLESVVMKRRPGAATIDTAWWFESGGRPIRTPGR